MVSNAEPSNFPDRYISLIVKHSESLGLMHQKQIDRNQENLKEAIAEFERLRACETNRLQESVHALDQEFRKVLTRLQEEFVSLAHEASEKLKADVRNCKRQYEKKLENRARELALELQSASFRSDLLQRNGAPISARHDEKQDERLDIPMLKTQGFDIDRPNSTEFRVVKKDSRLEVIDEQNHQKSSTDKENTRSCFKSEGETHWIRQEGVYRISSRKKSLSLKGA